MQDKLFQSAGAEVDRFQTEKNAGDENGQRDRIEVDQKEPERGRRRRVNSKPVIVSKYSR